MLQVETMHLFGCWTLTYVGLCFCVVVLVIGPAVVSGKSILYIIWPKGFHIRLAEIENVGNMKFPKPDGIVYVFLLMYIVLHSTFLSCIVETLLICIYNIAGVSTNTCDSQRACLTFEERNCIAGSRMVCLGSNPSATGCAQNAAIGEVINNMCSLVNGKNQYYLKRLICAKVFSKISII